MIAYDTFLPSDPSARRRQLIRPLLAESGRDGADAGPFASTAGDGVGAAGARGADARRRRRQTDRGSSQLPEMDAAHDRRQRWKPGRRQGHHLEEAGYDRGRGEMFREEAI